MANNDDYKKALALLLPEEGGFNNILGDPGGPTNLGISLRFLQSLAILNGTGDFDLADLDDDGDIDINDIRAMDPPAAARIYKKYFWDLFPMEEIPAQIAYVLFDVAVNSGQRVAAKLLQKAIGVTEDGDIGEETLYSLAMRDSAYSVADRMLYLRRTQYKNYAVHNPKLSKFLKGWLNRVDQLDTNLFEFD